MKTQEWKTTDKTDWGDGPWQGEADKYQFPDPATGLPCLIVRNGGGALCGYVGVSKGHPWFEKDYSEVECGWPSDEDAVLVHGGLTYSNHCQPEAEEGQGICHLVEPGEDDNVWWLGFDCAHLDDVVPVYDKWRKAILLQVEDFGRGNWGTYRDVAYLKAEIARLAKRAREVAGGLPG